MKKTYISPEFLLVELRCCNMLAESTPIVDDKTAKGSDGGWAKENNPISDKNLWNTEW